MTKAFVFNNKTQSYDLVYIKTRSVGTTDLGLFFFQEDGKIKFENLPPKTKQVLINEYTEIGLSGMQYPLQMWITVLKAKNRYTTEIELELFPLIFGEK